MKVAVARPNYSRKTIRHCASESLHYETKQLLQMALPSHLALPVHHSAPLQETESRPDSRILQGQKNVSKPQLIKAYLIKFPFADIQYIIFF